MDVAERESIRHGFTATLAGNDYSLSVRPFPLTQQTHNSSSSCVPLSSLPGILHSTQPSRRKLTNRRLRCTRRRGYGMMASSAPSIRATRSALLSAYLTANRALPGYREDVRVRMGRARRGMVLGAGLACSECKARHAPDLWNAVVVASICEAKLL